MEQRANSHADLGSQEPEMPEPRKVENSEAGQVDDWKAGHLVSY